MEKSSRNYASNDILVHCKLTWYNEWNSNRFYILIFIVWKLRFKVINACTHAAKVYLPFITSHSLIFLSAPPVANKDPEGLHRTAFTSPSWASYRVTIKWIHADTYIHVHVIPRYQPFNPFNIKSNCLLYENKYFQNSKQITCIKNNNEWVFELQIFIFMYNTFADA